MEFQMNIFVLMTLEDKIRLSNYNIKKTDSEMNWFFLYCELNIIYLNNKEINKWH